MKINLVIIFLVFVTFFSCNSTPNNGSAEKEKSTNDSTQVVTKYYKHSDIIEYKIPVLKGTGIKHGSQERLYRNGSLYSSIPYTNGKKEGTAFTYYQAAEGAKPKVWKEQLYKSNMLNGMCKRYHKDGTLQAEYEYKNGLQSVGLKEYYKSGKLIKQPTLIISKQQGSNGYSVTAKLSDKTAKVNYFIGALEEGKYLPKGLKPLPVKNGISQSRVSSNKNSVTITAVYSTRYNNKGIVSKTIRLQ